MSEHVKIDWKWGALAALAITILALYPQLHLWAHLGRSWAGTYAYFDTDEVPYSAYLQALIDGRPRRCDPYTGRDDRQDKPLAESVLSIQFIPPYLAAIPARVLGLSASSVFIVLMPMAAGATALTLFWLLAITTRDSRLAAVGVMVVLCLATLASGEGPIRALFGSVPHWSYLTFLRRYVPAIPFPFFLGMFGLIWRTVTAEDERHVVRSVGVGLIVAFLILSYFYLWTAALAWLACLTIVWLLARPVGWQRLIYSVSIVGVMAISVLVPYLILLGHRAENTDQLQVLEHTRSLDLFRPSELISLILLAGLGRLVLLRRLSLKDPEVLFVISLLLLPLAVFNQQIITSRSLQPFHYEEFVTSYSVLVAAVISLRLFLRRASFSRLAASQRLLFWIAVISLIYGANSAAGISGAALSDNILRDKSMAVARRLRESGQGNNGLVLPFDMRQAETLPTLSPQAVLWAPHMSMFSGSGSAELKERFWQFLYYSGVSPQALHELLASKNHVPFVTLFGFEREAGIFAKDFRPITTQELDGEVRLYSDYVNSFSRVTAGQYPLTYLIVPPGPAYELANLDRWYERDGSEQVGDFTIYSVKLRP
jgi:hypothetical protein